MVFDATGVLGAAGRVEQTAYGVVVPATDVLAPGEAVEDLLAEVPEGRVPEVVGEPGRLDDVRVAAAELVEHGREGGVGHQPFGDGAGDLGDLEAVGEPVVEQARPARADDLGDPAQPCEERRGDDAVPVDPERARREIPGRRPGHLLGAAFLPWVDVITHAPTLAAV